MSEDHALPEAPGAALGSTGSDVERLQRYLVRYGYLDPDAKDVFGFHRQTTLAAPAMFGEFDEVTSQALSHFQSRRGIPATGELDPPTLALIRLPRCGVPDVVLRQEDFAVFGSKWPQTGLRYGYGRLETSLPGPQINAAMRQAFDIWSAHSPCTFTELDPSQGVDITIQFIDPDDRQSFAEGEAAHAWAPEDGHVHFKATLSWVVADHPRRGVDLIAAAVHEIGHLLGLAHSDVPGAAMWPTLTGQRTPQPDDIAGIRSIYPG